MKLFVLLGLISAAAAATTTAGSGGVGGVGGSSDKLGDGETECECDTEEDVCDDDDKNCAPYQGTVLCRVRSTHPKAKLEDGTVTNVCKWNQECKEVKENAALTKCITKKNKLCVKFQFLGGWGAPEETGANGKAIRATECDTSEHCCDGQCCKANENCQGQMGSATPNSLDFEYDFSVYTFDDIVRNDGKLPDGTAPKNMPRKCVPKPQAVTWISAGLLPTLLIIFVCIGTAVTMCIGKCGWDGACGGKMMCLTKAVTGGILVFASIMLFFTFSWFYALVSLVLFQIADAALSPNKSNTMEDTQKKAKWVVLVELIWFCFLIGGINFIPIGGEWFQLNVGRNMFSVFLSNGGDIATLNGFCTQYFHGYFDFGAVNSPLWYKDLAHDSGKGILLCMEEWLTFTLIMYLLVVLVYLFRILLHALVAVRFDKADENGKNIIPNK